MKVLAIRKKKRRNRKRKTPQKIPLHKGPLYSTDAYIILKGKNFRNTWD